MYLVAFEFEYTCFHLNAPIHVLRVLRLYPAVVIYVFGVSEKALEQFSYLVVLGCIGMYWDVLCLY